MYTFLDASAHHMWGDSAFAAINAVLASYAIVAFIGIRTSLVDIWVNVLSWLYRPQRYDPAPSRRGAPESVSSDTHLADWEMVLYLGFAERRRTPRAATLPAPPAHDVLVPETAAARAQPEPASAGD